MLPKTFHLLCCSIYFYRACKHEVEKKNLDQAKRISSSFVSEHPHCISMWKVYHSCALCIFLRQPVLRVPLRWLSLIFTFLSKVIKRFGKKKLAAEFCVEWLQKYNEIIYRRCGSSKFLTQAFEDCGWLSKCTWTLPLHNWRNLFLRLSVKDSVKNFSRV